MFSTVRFQIVFYLFLFSFVDFFSSLDLDKNVCMNYRRRDYNKYC